LIEKKKICDSNKTIINLEIMIEIMVE